jgi:hypothetical protein
MNRYFLASLCFLVVAIAVGFALAVSLAKNVQLRDEITQLNYELDKKTEAMGHSTLGMAILSKMASSDEYTAEFRQLDSIPATSLRCDIFDFSEFPADRLESVNPMEFQRYNPFHSPRIQLVTFFQETFSDDLTRRVLPPAQAKAVLVLVKGDSLEIVDSMVHNGTCSQNKTYYGGPPYADDVSAEFGLDLDQPDNTVVRYRILPTGFEPIK